MPPVGSDLLLLTCSVTRLFSARCFVPHQPHGSRLCLFDPAFSHPSIPSGSPDLLISGSYPAGASGGRLYH
ncbi:unnamed protein product [Staurois parvus]|uniref:Secreted protein n=1 Tax=Staurois parvus TaxID=386267 RepID=A0ABN9H8C8_9NEOB|nr:unnamed protein product [Staurois parvus]